MPINKFTTLLDLARQAKILTGETATFDGKIQLGIPFSGYPTGVDTGTTVSLGVVGSETAIFSGGTGTTVFDVANSASPNYSPLFNGFSGNVWTNPLFSGNTSGLTLPITPLSAETQIVGPVWVVTQTGMTGDYVIDTQYTGYTITYSFTFGGDVPTTAYTSYSGFTTATQENFSAGTLDYKGPLDYISSVEDATIDGRLTTNKLTVTGGASSATTGYVLTQTGDTGEVGWVFNSASATTNTFVTGGTLNGSNLDLTWNTGGSVPSIDLSPLSASTNFANTDLTLTGDRVHDLSGYTVTLKDEKDDQTRLIVENLFNGGSANSAVSVRSRGAGGVTISGTILYGGDSFNGYGSFTDGGSGLLTNAFSMTSLGGNTSQRGNINIGSRRGTESEVRIFNGGDDFDFTSLRAKFTTTGFTSYQDVYIDNLPSESVLGTDANGKIIAGTTTYWDEGSGLFDKLGNHTMSSGSNTDFSIIAGGEGNEISAGFPLGKWNAILGGSGNTISASNFGVIRNGIFGGEGNEIGGVGAGNENCVIIGGQSNIINGTASDSVIIGMSGKTVGNGSNKVYTPSLDITGDFLITNDSPFSTTSKQVYTNFTTSGITQMNISGGSEDLTFLAVNSPNYGGISMGIRGETSIYNAYGAPGDGYIYSSVFNNGLNIISQPTAAPPSTAQTTDDYIRFYAGRDALFTSDIHIQGSGTTRGNIGINNESPTSKLDIIETTGYQQLRLRTSYTPTSTADANGEIGDIAWDDDYIYIKTSIGWRRSTLTSF